MTRRPCPTENSLSKSDTDKLKCCQNFKNLFFEQILIKIHDVDPNNSDQVKDALSSFFQCLPKYKELHSLRLLRELEIVTNRFPKYCMSHRSNIETFLIHFLSSNNYFNVIEAAKCAHALQQVRPTQEKSATPKTSWRDQMSFLCTASHFLIESVFRNVVDMYSTTTKPQTPSRTTPMSLALIDITKNLEDVKDKQPLLYLRLKNILVFIQAMLVETYPVAKPIQPQIILDVIVRLSSVTSSIKQNDMNICTIKLEALRTLDALVVCLGSNLIPYSPLVFRLVLQTLRWSSDNPSDDTSKVRCAAYYSLGNWLTTLHVHRTSDNRSTWEDELANNIIADITPVKKVVQLTMGPQPTRNLSKKAKRKLATTQLQESNLAAYGPGVNKKITLSEEVNNEIAIAALECAEIFLTVCGRFLKPATHKLFQERLVHECYNYSLYTDKQLLALLHVLEASRKTTPNSVPPTTQYCLHLYSLLINSRHAEISKFCSQSLLDIRLHLHCSPPSLNFDLEVLPEAAKASNKRKKISERNRAMLESLLGVDKLATAENEDDVISIPDEPTSKKPRLKCDENDKISVSSDSVSSVEISDDSDDDNVQEVKLVVEMNQSNPESDDIEPMVITEEVIEEEIELEDSNEQTQKLNGNMEVQKELACTENEISDEIEINKEPKNVPIYEAQTQIQLEALNDTIEEERPLSLEIGYDFPNTDTEKVPVLEKIDDENLPLTNDTDDIQITCGQVVKSSQEVEIEKKCDETEPKPDEIPKANGVPEIIVENGLSEETAIEITVNETVKDSLKNDGTSVEDMLADFVDEVNEDAVDS